jgi:hypothetical protein
MIGASSAHNWTKSIQLSPGSHYLIVGDSARLWVTGQRSDQLSYVPRLFFNNLGLCHIE